jgi:hypothetical protein
MSTISSSSSSGSGSSSSTTTSRRFMEMEPGFACFEGGPLIYSTISKIMAVFIPCHGVYTPTATAWDCWQKINDRVLLYQRVLDVFGSVCGQVARYNAAAQSDTNIHGDLRNIATVTVVPRADHSLIPAGFLLMLSVALPAHEDLHLLRDCKPFTDEPTAAALKKLAAVRQARDPQWIVSSRLMKRAAQDSKESSGSSSSTSHKAKPKAPESWFDTMTRDDYIAMVTAYTDYREKTTDAMRMLDLTESANPANIMRAFSLENACRLIRNSGGDPRYCYVRNYMTVDDDNGAVTILHPDGGKRTWRVQPGPASTIRVTKSTLPTYYTIDYL